jgi:hypothetical protein
MTALVSLLIAGTAWAVPGLNDACEPMRRLTAALVESSTADAPVPRPPSAEPGQELPASDTPAPLPATEPLAPAPTVSQEPPRAPTTAKPGQRKAKPREHAKPVNGHRSATLDENTASGVLDRSLVQGYIRESKAKLKSCYDRSVEHGRPATVEVQFVIKPDGTGSLLASTVIGDNAEVSRCVAAFVEDIKGIKFLKSGIPVQEVVSVSLRVE